MTFDPSHLFPWVWPEVKGDAESVNDADYLLLEFAGIRAGEDVEWVWLSRGCVDLRIQEIKLAVA